jgi:hypothetical protein
MQALISSGIIPGRGVLVFQPIFRFKILGGNRRAKATAVNAPGV